MSKQQLSLTYHNDSTLLFSAIRDLPFACWLDSGKPNSHSGRYDIMTAAPKERWISQGGTTQHIHYTDQKPVVTTTNDDPFERIKAIYARLLLPSNIGDIESDLPFNGGLIAYFSYDLGRQQLNIPQISPNRCTLPDMVVGLYTWAIVQDHELKQCHLTSLPNTDIPTKVQQRLKHLQDVPQAKTFSIGELTSDTSTKEYHQKLTTINDYINAGDCYQVNFSQCFSAKYQGDPYIAYIQLRKAMSSPFSAFMDLGEQCIMSLSPERFLKINNRQVLTQPIKGTIPRDKDHYIDQENAQKLQTSRKNQAENLMIVDLLRNDLGKSCIPGSIDVPNLFELHSFPNVHHLISTITGTARLDKTAIDVFQDAFPGGSITGAPKKRAMEIIEALENGQRSIYCGSIAYINGQGNLDSNITIRTIACDGKKLYCWGGGGIVADSEAELEYQESLTKIHTILRVLESFL
ncbi:aminodeoxychorismate synthase, component I [Candidatus Endobugula sertula]|uniref:aminodeoxychorismate synthase n=1 Tax=Candidatus Endobugula sertula TaxID=62101 RepID=A0A1D2QNB9_9GAMM|nr:aminodeoxychorismate synthase, component I [Candidatus Endobugula sertula]